MRSMSSNSPGSRSWHRVSSGGLVLSLFLVLSLAIPSSSQSQEGTLPIGPNQGVAFDQVSFEFSEAREPFSTWGRVSIDSRRVAASTGLASGYINVSTELGWVLWNLPFNAEDEASQVFSYFTISSQNGIPVKDLHAAISATPLPIPYTEKAALLRAADLGTTFPVGRAVWNAEGIGDLHVMLIEPAPTLAEVYAKIALELRPVNTQHTQPNAVNVQTAVNQCFPMSIANSLQYLENRYGIAFPHNHQAGLKGDNTLVGQLDSYAGRYAPSRTNGSGVWFQPMLDGKFEYLSDNGLSGSIVHRHQGRGYGSAAAGQALPSGNFTRHGITSTDDGAAVTFSWLCEQIQKGEDVELVFSYDNASGQPTGGHAVRVFECGTTLGVPWIGYLHDSQQNNDSAGLETVRVNIVDLDGDGMLNLGVTSREIRFAMSESRVEDYLIRLPGITKSVDETVITLGGELTYTISLSNPSTYDISGILLSDPLPYEVSFSSFIQPLQGITFNPESNALEGRFDLGALDDIQIIYNVDLNPEISGGTTFANCVMIEGPGFVYETCAPLVTVCEPPQAVARGKGPTGRYSRTECVVVLGEEVYFDGKRSHDPDGQIVSYSWDFDDRTTATGSEVEHVYSRPGRYNVCLTVTDDHGITDTDCVRVEVVKPLMPG